ncbi:Folylpolyglutamate synthase [Chlorella vulgaris]
MEGAQEREKLPSEEEEYERALVALSSLISGRQRKDGAQWAHAFEMMQSYLERLGLEEQLGRLSVIHVAGTKGKGSTCAMVERMLRQAGYTTGLFTSPHLIDVRERIRINGEPVDKSTFLRNLWWCFDRLEEKATDDSGKPAYFRFLTLLGFKVFLEAGVDVVVLEVGLGGRLDATNCVRSPVVCGVSSLGFDHMELLGHTLPEIAREKAGIFKPAVPAFTVPQREDAAEALHQRAAAVGTSLSLVRPWQAIQGAADVTLGLAGEHQKLNAALAVALAGAWEGRSAAAAAVQGARAAERASAVAAGQLPPEYAAGLQAASWPGRGQIVHDAVAGAVKPLASPAAAGSNGTAAEEHQGQEAESEALPRLSFYLDGAHTAESMATCAHWFADAVGGPQQPAAAAGSAQAHPGGLVTQRVLLFNCMQERDPQNLLQPLAHALRERHIGIHHALFVPPDSTYMKLGAGSEPATLSWQHSLRSVWEGTGGSSSSSSIGSSNGISNGISSNGSAAAPRAAAPPPLTLPPLPAVAAPAGLPQAAAVALASAQGPGSRSAVLPSLSVTLDWLRRCVREAPALRMQVLVTGSLYLVGDLLKVLQPPPQPQQQAVGTTRSDSAAGVDGSVNGLANGTVSDSGSRGGHGM